MSVKKESAIRKKLIGARNEIYSSVAVAVPDVSDSDGDGEFEVMSFAQLDSGVSDVIDFRSRQIAEALIRLDQGTYGYCAKCGGVIPERRLEALPFAIFCVPCQAIVDRVHRNQ